MIACNNKGLIVMHSQFHRGCICTSKSAAPKPRTASVIHIHGKMLVALGRDDLHKSYLGYTYCDDLEALGYIKMQGNGKDKKIFIIKDIDFLILCRNRMPHRKR